MWTRALHRLMAAGSLAGALLVGACGDFNVTNPNQPPLDTLLISPTRTKLAAAAAGILIGVRTSTGAAGDLTGYIWRLGSMGREGVNLSGNNQPDYSEPYFGPLSGTGFGGSEWTNFYRAIRSTNIYLDAAPKAATVAGAEGLSAAEVSASLGYGKTLKALAFMYIVAGHGSLGAPVDVDHPITDPPAPFVSEDSVYGYIIATLTDAQNDLRAAGSLFPFTLPSGFSGFGTPATFLAFNHALTAKAYIFRATADSVPCTSCYSNALKEIDSATAAFGVGDPSQFKTGVYMNFSAGAGDTQNELSDALDAPNFFAVPEVVTLAHKQADGTTPDARVGAKTAAATASSPQKLNAIPILGTLKFTTYLTGGNADPAAPIPIIRNEELVLLRAEANIGLNNFGPGAGTALDDINFIRAQSGNLPAYSGPVTRDSLIGELLYNRRYSLLWEQGATWVDARRYGRIVVAANGNHQILGIGELPGFGVPPIAPSDVPLRLLVPDDECRARGLESGCSPLGT